MQGEKLYENSAVHRFFLCRVSDAIEYASITMFPYFTVLTVLDYTYSISILKSSRLKENGNGKNGRSIESCFSLFLSKYLLFPKKWKNFIYPPSFISTKTEEHPKQTKTTSKTTSFKMPRVSFKTQNKIKEKIKSLATTWDIAYAGACGIWTSFIFIFCLVMACLHTKDGNLCYADWNIMLKYDAYWV